MDLDNIDIKFIYIILDTLELFKLYKLCIFVCNRYKLTKRLGRYLVSIAHKYSTIANETATINNLHIIPGAFRNVEMEKAFISSIALHNVLENVNPEFLRLKGEGEEAKN